MITARSAAETAANSTILIRKHTTTNRTTPENKRETAPGSDDLVNSRFPNIIGVIRSRLTNSLPSQETHV